MKLKNLFEEYAAYVLSDKSRRELKKTFPPIYPDFIGHHITYKFGSGHIPPSAELTVIGHVDDGAGVEALVVAVNGKSERADGGIYHITWSIDRSKNRKPVHSNGVVRSGFDSIKPISIDTTPAVL